MKGFLKAGALLAVSLAMTNCSSSGSGGGSADSSLSISGTLGTASLMSMPSQKMGSVNAFDAVNLTDLQVQATAFTNPPQIVTANVNSDGSFSVKIPGAKGTAITAVFVDKNDNSQVGELVFEDTSSKDLNGKSSQTSTAVLTDSVPLGAITLGTDGKVKIPVAQIADKLGSTAAVSVATSFDPTGTWYMKAFDSTLPTGYGTVTSDCSHDGPCIGFPITLVRLAGKKFTPATGQCDPNGSPVTCAVTDGTVSSEDRFALSIWGDTFNHGIGACGSKVGFTAAEARAFGQISVSTLPTVEGNSISFGPYVYSTPTGFGGDGAPFDKPWMKDGATSAHDLMDCQPYSVTHNSVTYNAWACKAEKLSGAWNNPTHSGTYGWQVGIEGGGCFNTTTGKPVNVTNWANLGFGTCTESDSSATYGTGFKTHTCTYQNADHDGNTGTPAINVSCSNIGGQFTDSSGPTSTPMTLNNGEYLGQPTTLVYSGATCSSIGHATTAATLAAYRCYAEAYWSANISGLACQRDYRFNWAATTPEDFANDNERGKPKNAFVTNILNYSPDGQMATLEDEERENITISTGPNSSTFCEASRRTVITFKKVTDSRMLIDLRQSGQMNSTDAACIAAAKDALAGKNVGGGNLQDILTPQKMMFYADKNP